MLVVRFTAVNKNHWTELNLPKQCYLPVASKNYRSRVIVTMAQQLSFTTHPIYKYLDNIFVILAVDHSMLELK